MMSLHDEVLDAHVVGVVLAQHYSLKKAQKLFGDKADAAVMKELTESHELNAYIPEFEADLSKKDKRDALEALLFLT